MLLLTKNEKKKIYMCVCEVVEKRTLESALTRTGTEVREVSAISPEHLALFPPPAASILYTAGKYTLWIIDAAGVN